MGRGRSRLALVACVLTMFAVGGCGSSSSSTGSEGPQAAKVQVTLSSIGPRARPERIKIGTDGPPLHGTDEELEVIFVIHNELDHAAFLEVHGGVYIEDDHNSEPVQPNHTGTLRVPLHVGIHQLNGSAIPNQTNGQLFIAPPYGKPPKT
jgi:hypothetical protein